MVAPGWFILVVVVFTGHIGKYNPLQYTDIPCTDPPKGHPGQIRILLDPVCV